MNVDYDDMYAVELTEDELREPDAEPSLTCPECLSDDLRFTMRYDIEDSETGYDGTGEVYQCRACHSTGDAKDCESIGPFPIARRNPAREERPLPLQEVA